MNTDWTSALAIIAAGLIAGAMLIYLVARRKAVPRDLEDERDTLLEQIRALPADAVEERQRLELETASILREMDRIPKRTSRAPQWAMGIAGLTIVLGGLGYFVSASSTNKQVAPEPVAVAATPVADLALQTLEANVLKSPDNLELRNDLARAYVERDNLMAVFEQTEYVLAKSPKNSRALTYQALVKSSMGKNAEAAVMLKEALQSDPAFLDAYVTLAWVQTQAGQTADAQNTMNEALRRHPDDSARLQQVFDQMKPAPAATAAAIRVTLEGPARDGVVFVIARPAGEPKGHPLAVKRLEASSLPATFDFGDADSMMGSPLPPSIRLEARIDSDGDIITKDPTEPFAFQDGVKSGASIKLALK
jgi:tetratricopeptide (TPR) repeat protein